ncbi:MAG: Na/Pi cotransporter family protein [Succinivibrionaceae bacterium]
MSSYTITIFGLIGGLAMFLFGMNTMSDALQKVAGTRMKQILSALTKNPILGVFAGALVTTVLQSSSATTVMVIGFVSARLMPLPQAISVIFGANIGTTMTAQIIAFKLSNYIYPIIFLGFIMHFLSKSEKIRNIGLVIFSFGLLFNGIEIMGTVMKPLAKTPLFTELMTQVADIPLLGLALGTIMTVVVQSSSATIAVLQNFASQPNADGVSSLGLNGAIPILLGDNIGTTITALLACIGQSRDAKRTAVAHSVFNVTGAIIFTCIIPFFADFVRWISPSGNEISIISRQIANAHTTFNVCNTLIWLPMIPIMVTIVNFIVKPQAKEQVQEKANFLDINVFDQPIAALYLVSKQITDNINTAKEIMKDVFEKICLQNKKISDTNINDKLKSLNKDHELTTEYMSKLIAHGVLTPEQAEQVSAILTVENNISRIANRVQDINEAHNRITSDHFKLSDSARIELRDFFENTRKLLKNTSLALLEQNIQGAETILNSKIKFRKNAKYIFKNHLHRVEEQVCSPDVTANFYTIIHSLCRITDNCSAIAEEVASNETILKLDNNSKKIANEFLKLSKMDPIGEVHSI